MTDNESGSGTWVNEFVIIITIFKLMFRTRSNVDGPSLEQVFGFSLSIPIFVKTLKHVRTRGRVSTFLNTAKISFHAEQRGWARLAATKQPVLVTTPR